MVNASNHWAGIAADPPDPSFRQLTLLGARTIVDLESNDPLLVAMANLSTVANNEAAIGEAFRRSIERYQGAAAAFEAEFALIHARAARAYADLLAAQLPETNAAAATLAAVLSADPLDFDTIAANLAAINSRVSTSGFTADELDTLRSLGLTAAEIDDIRTAMLDIDFASISRAGLLTTLADIQTTNTALIPELNALSADISTRILPALEIPENPDLFPIADAGGPYSGAEGTPVSFDASGSVANGIFLTFAWDLDNDGVFDDAIGANPSFTFNQAFQGSVGVQATNNTGRPNIAYASITITNVNSPPSIDAFSPTDIRPDVPVGTSQLFSVTTSDPNGDSVGVEWTVDGVSVATGNTFTLSPGSADRGLRVIDATATDASPLGGSVRQRWSALVFFPDADGDGFTSDVDCDDADPGVNPGQIEVVGDGKDNDCDVATPDSGSPPVADFTFSPAIGIAGQPVQFTDTSTDTNNDIVAFEWDLDNDGQFDDATGQTPQFTFPAAGTFTVSLRVTDQGLPPNTDIASKEIPVTEPPTASFTFSPDPGTGGEPVQFTDTSTDDGTIVARAWDFGDGGTSSLQNPSHIYAPGGPFTVTLTVTDDAGATDTTSRSIALTGRPVASFTVSPATGIVGEAVQFTDTSTGDGEIVAFEWDFETDGTVDSSLQNPTHTYATGGNFTVTLTVTDDAGATNTATRSIAVTLRPAASFTFSPNTGVAKETVQFTDTSTDDGTIVAFEWDFGDGNTTNLQNPTHTYATGGNFTVTLTVTDDAGATDTTSRSIAVTGLPKASFTFSPATGIVGEAVQFTDTSTDDGAIVAFEWDFETDGTVDSTLQNPTHVFPTVGTFAVSLTVTDDSGKSDTATQSIAVTQPPAASFTFSPLAPVPAREPVPFTDTSTDDGTIIGRAWDFGDGGTSNLQNPAHTFRTDGDFDVSLTVTDDKGATDTATQTITVLPNPEPPPPPPVCSISWDAAVSGSRTDASKWDPARLPDAADDVCIVVDGTYTVTVNGSRSVNSLTLGVPANTLVQTLAVRGIQGLSSTLSVANGLANDGTINLESTGNGSAFLGVTNGTLRNDATINLNAGGTNQQRTLRANLANNGTVNITTSDARFDKTDGVATNNGAFNIAEGAALTFGTRSVFNQDGGTLSNLGSFAMSSDTFNFNGGGRVGQRPGAG